MRLNGSEQNSLLFTVELSAWASAWQHQFSWPQVPQCDVMAQCATAGEPKAMGPAPFIPAIKKPVSPVEQVVLL